MKTKASIIIILAVALLISCVSCQSAVKPPSVEAPPSEESIALFDTVAKASAGLSSEVRKAQMGFALRMLQALNDEHKDDNVVLSPQSISTALGMTYIGAKGETADEMAKVLGIEGLTMGDVASGYKRMAGALTDSGDTKVENANAIWVDEGFPIVGGFQSTMEGAFLAPVNSIDLQGDKALPTINGWIKKNTNDMIDKLFTEPFGDLDRVVLCNAIFFDGKWTMPFDPECTYDAPFDGKGNVKMMKSEEPVQGKVGEGYTSVMLPYGDDERFSMVAVLPEGDVNTFIQGLDEDAFLELFKGYEEKDEAIVMLPKFKIDEKVSLKDTLKAMGMVIPFDGERANFDNMGPELSISDVLHRARIEVDEVGTKAAAVTGVVMKCESAPMDQFIFRADRPFVFFIYDSQEQLVLFSAKVTQIKD